MVYLYHGILSSHEDEGHPAICNIMNETRGHYAKGNKPHRERQVLYDLICGIQKKKVKVIETESRTVVPRGWGWIKGNKSSV